MKPFSGLKLEPLNASAGLRRLACDAIKRAITEMDIYGHAGEIWLDERQLSSDLGVSRTPIREALSFLEQEGFVRSVPRRGVLVVRKSRQEILDMITVWAAIESASARLAVERAGTENFEGLRALFAGFNGSVSDHIDTYSQANMAFHKAIIRMGRCDLMRELTDTIFIHMRAVRAVAMGQDNRAERSIADHMRIIDALERRDADLAERLVREHTLGLAAHIEARGDLLGDGVSPVPPPQAKPRRARAPSPRPAQSGKGGGTGKSVPAPRGAIQPAHPPKSDK